jgi:diguanylate cyclase (GGDEF)-like protein
VATDTGRDNTAQRFAVFEDLLRRLLPRGLGIAVADPSATILYSSDSLSRPEVDVGVKALAALLLRTEAAPRAAGQPLPGGELLAGFALRDGEARSGALMVLVRDGATAAGEDRLRPLVQILKPVLSLIGREIVALRQAANDSSEPAAAESSEPADSMRECLIDLKREWGAAAVVVALRDPARRIWVPAPPPAAVGKVWESLETPLLNWTAVKREPLLFNETPGARQGAPTCRVACTPLLDEAGHAVGVFAALRDASHPAFPGQLRERLARVGQEVMLPLRQRVDALTGTLTRPAFQSELEHRVARHEASGRDWMLYLNVDRLHLVNLHHGFRVGDALLGWVGRLTAARLPAPALVGRLGGDQFAAFLPATGEREARQCAESLRAQVERWQPPAGGQPVRVSLSVGMAPFDPDIDPAHTLAAAEIACKAAKDRGRNRVEVFTASDDSLVQRHEDLAVVRELSFAIESRGVVLYAQGIHPTAAGTGPIGLEVLSRLQRRDGRILTPDEFMSAAARYQLLPQFDRIVIDAALRMLSEHSAAFLEHYAFVAFNVSGPSVADPGFVPYLEQAIAGSGLPADRLLIEITESVASQQLEAAARLVRAVNRMGAMVALDDFGTGFSSLEHLKDLPVQFLKIDGAFVRDLGSNARATSLIRLIVQLAQSLKLKTVAEHIETTAAWGEVASLGVDYVQGFAAGRAAPLKDLLAQAALFQMATGQPAEHVVLESSA